jgi:PhzF family phenazine biosynthesis protein
VVRRFAQVDVFGGQPFGGNPVAVVLDGDGLSTDEMQRIANWTNLSETTFVLPPRTGGADYRVRIFTPAVELPFAGHPTLGTCHAWLDGAERDEVVQECDAGLVRVRRTPDGLAFAAPPLIRSGPADEAVLERVAGQLGITRGAIVAAEWVDNGPGWLGVLLADAEAVLALRPGLVDLDLGVVGLHPPGSETAIELRAFSFKDGATYEDPVTGSLNASVAGWLRRTGRVPLPYTASQGTALGRCGRIHLSIDDEGTIWTAGATRTVVTGTIEAQVAAPCRARTNDGA